MKKQIAIITVTVLLLYSCLGVIDTESNKPVTEVEQTDLTGNWKADKFSYEFTVNFIKNETQKINDSISLVLKPDGTFKLKNGLNLKDDSISQKDYSGTWKLAKRIQKGHKDQFEIRFKSKDGFGGMPNRIPIYKGKNQYRLFMFIGDPDLGERIGLTKETQIQNND